MHTPIAVPYLIGVRSRTIHIFGRGIHRLGRRGLLTAGRLSDESGARGWGDGVSRGCRS